MRKKEVVFLVLLAVCIMLMLATRSFPQRKTVAKPVPVRKPPQPIPAPGPPVPIEPPARQFSFDEAKAHKHEKYAMVDGDWKSRTVVPGVGASAYLLGNAFTIKTDDGKLKQFYHLFGIDEAVMISMLSGTWPAQPRVSVIYDPECNYATAVKDITVHIQRPPEPPVEEIGPPIPPKDETPAPGPKPPRLKPKSPTVILRAK